MTQRGRSVIRGVEGIAMLAISYVILTGGGRSRDFDYTRGYVDACLDIARREYRAKNRPR